jgi:hypothetical protein
MILEVPLWPEAQLCRTLEVQSPDKQALLWLQNQSNNI